MENAARLDESAAAARDARLAIALGHLGNKLINPLRGRIKSLAHTDLVPPLTKFRADMYDLLKARWAAITGAQIAGASDALLAALRMHVAVPRRVAIAGFNDLTGSDQMLPALTTVRTPRAQIGEAAAQMLLSLMRGEAPEAPQLDLGFEIVQRQSS